jgi:hypothetical protein
MLAADQSLPSGEHATRNRPIDDAVAACPCGELATFRVGAALIGSGHGATFLCTPHLDKRVEMTTWPIDIYQLPYPGAHNFGAFVMRHVPGATT